jgi:hypothetical protein
VGGRAGAPHEIFRENVFFYFFRHRDYCNKLVAIGAGPAA